MAKVLIAEPSAEVRALLERSVRRCGHEPLVYERWRPGGPPEADVLLLEPALHGGLELARALRERSPRPAIVICSIFPPSPELRELEAVAHVLKPFPRDVLEAALRTATAAATGSA